MGESIPPYEQLPELVDAARVAGILAVPRHRVPELATEESFPPAVARLGESPLWPAAAIRRWSRVAAGRPGRRLLQEPPADDLLDDTASYPVGTTIESTHDGRISAITVRRRY